MNPVYTFPTVREKSKYRFLNQLTEPNPSITRQLIQKVVLYAAVRAHDSTAY